MALDTLKMCRDAGLLVGLCTHNHEVIDYAAERDWDVDFYMGAFYRVSYAIQQQQRRCEYLNGEFFEEEARREMVRTIQQVSKPCIAYKILAANRHCRKPDGVQRAIRFALEHIKPNDTILLGMWQKHTDQVAENVGYVREALG